ncbi:tetratricopeptide repeat protein [Roseibacillus persicicus]|uniref:tetratricopeptide repeat protein n=1 Tax=Roseibacillus persicicus TaxID=454148 RepID=UPI00398A9F24
MPRLLQRQRLYRRLLIAALILVALIAANLFWQTEKKRLAETELAQTQETLDRVRQDANLGNRAREQAEDLATFMLEDLRDQLIPLGRNDLIAQSAERTLNYFDNLPPALATPNTLGAKASILSTLANVDYANGDFVEAEQKWQEVISLRKQQIASEPPSLDLALQLVNDYNERAVPLREANEVNAARKSNQAALQLLENLSPSLVANDAELVRTSRASTLFGLGEIERAVENQEGAISYYISSRKAFEGKVPDDILAQQVYMTSFNNEGWCQMSLGDDESAGEAYRQGLQPARRLIELQPDNRNWLKEIATLLNNLGTIHDERGENEMARPYYEEALEMRSSLVTWDPTNTLWQLDYLNSLRNLGSLAFDEERDEEAFELIRQSLRGWQTLLSREPDNIEWMHTLQEETRHFQEKFQSVEKNDLALRLNQETREFAESLSQGTAVNSAAWNQFLSKLYNDISANDETDPEEAIKSRLRATTLRANNLENANEDQETRYQLAASYLDIALDCIRGKRMDEALACLQLSRFIFTEHTPPLLYRREQLIDLILREEQALANSPHPPLIPADAIWNYYDSRNPPSDDWFSPDYNDHGWAKGAAELGYGDADEATVIDFGPDSERKNLTAWFRHGFTMTESQLASDLGSLRLSLLCDDGAVIYLNGVELLRHHMPTGEISPTTLASYTMSGMDETIYRIFILDPAKLPLHGGTNILAAEVHQNEPPSSDLSFALELLPRAPISPPMENFNLPLAKRFLGDALPPVVLSWVEEYAQSERP